ncbi:MAG: AAA family ATPase [Planctomycetota bacterium]|jgi:exonuclease SbcC
MIKSLEIKGFEKHKNSNLNFSDKINLIIGSSHIGKSSIIKSIKWLNDNIPAGEGFINHNMEECFVKVEFQDDNFIERIKNKNENKYIVNEKSLEAIGKKVPSEVKEITRFTNLNIQGQFDKFFLLQDVPGEVARKLNEIVNLQIMDGCIKRIKSKVNKKNQDIKYLQNEIKEIKEEIKKYDWIDNADNLLKKVEQKEEKVRILEADIDLLFNYQSELDKYNKELKIINKKLKSKKLFNQIKDKFNEYEKQNLSYEKLSKLNDEFISNKERLKKYENLEEKKKIFVHVNKIYKNYKEVTEQIKLLEEILLYKSQIINLDKNIKRLKEQKEKILPKGSICPLCNQEIRK